MQWKLRSRVTVLTVLVTTLALASVSWAASKEKVLYAFKGGNDGQEPESGLTLDNSGNLYGTTLQGGVGTGCLGNSGCGTVFRLTPEGQETVLHTFAGGTDGAYPYIGVVIGQGGNLYGATEEGGSDQCTGGCGVIYKIAPDGTETILSTDLVDPDSLILDGTGNLFGTTGGGGGGYGTIFELTPDNTETVLYYFEGPPIDAAFPYSLIRDAYGNLFGTAAGGEFCTKHANEGCGTLFELTAGGTETVLFDFTRHNLSPGAGVIEDKRGNLYGVTLGGRNRCEDGYSCGSVFEFRH
jgi:uncharacterized repeat protein (TIGR03803 family)